jgi:hypothetical protein
MQSATHKLRYFSKNAISFFSVAIGCWLLSYWESGYCGFRKKVEIL